MTKKKTVSLNSPGNVTRLNALLRAMGEKVRVARHWDSCSLYFYDAEGSEAICWYTSTVGIARASNQSLLDWIRDLAALRCSWQNVSRPDRTEAEEFRRLRAAALATGRVTV